MIVPDCIGEAPCYPDPPEIVPAPQQRGTRSRRRIAALRRAADHLDPDRADASTIDERTARVGADALRELADLLQGCRRRPGGRP